MSGYQLVEHEKPFRYDEDGLHVTRTSAWSGPGCHIGCGVLLYADDDGKLVKVEGDPENPFNKGRLCNRCLALPEVVYNPDRITTPLVRDRVRRGEDAWEQVSWAEAIDLIYERFTAIKERYGAWSIPFVQGTGRDIAPWITRLAWSFGSPNYLFFMSGMACYLPRVAGCAATTGSFWVGDFSQQFPDRYDDPAWVPAEYIMVWGNNPLVANSDGFYGHWMVDVMKRGSKLIVVDPRLTWLASKAEWWLQVRPGTDAALALGMLNVIISEDLYDHDFVDRWCYGFDELAQTAAAYPVDKVAEITWVPAEKIVGAARAWAGAENGIVQWGLTVDTTKESLPAAQAIGALWQVCGFCEKPGCMIVPPEILAYSGGFGGELVKTVRAAYDRYEFHGVYRAIYNFCVVDMSNFYLDIIKDRLYCGDDADRAAAQTALYQILDGMTRMLAPMLAFTSEEIWAAMPHAAGDEASCVLLNDIPSYDEKLRLDEALAAQWDKVIALRMDVNKALEAARSQKLVGKSLDAEVTLYFNEAGKKEFESMGQHDLAAVCIVSKVTVAEGEGEGLAGENFPGVTVAVAPAEAPKCSRCWTHNVQVDPETELCPRCAGVLKKIHI